MLTPDYLYRITEGAEQIASELHANIIKRIIERMMIRLGRGEDYLLTATDKWQIEVLQEAGYLLEDIQKELADKTKKQVKEIQEAMEDAGVQALSWDDKIYQAAGLSPVRLLQSPALMRLMQRNYEATMGTWNNFTRTTAGAAQRLFIEQMDNAYNMVTSGAVSYTSAVSDVIDNVSDVGVKVNYPSGYRMSIEAATMMIVRTGISQAAADVGLGRMIEHGVGYALTSSHMGARPTHEPWQGKVFSIDWNTMKQLRPELFTVNKELPQPDREYPDFVESTRFGYVDGLCGANCRHSFSAFYPGISTNPFEQYDSEENQKAYKIQQRQRALERQIRDTKRKVQNLQTAVDACRDEQAKFELQQKLDRKSYTLSQQNKAYKKYCTDNGLKEYDTRLKVAKWDRQQAVKAAGAARRYQNAKGD